MTDVSEARLPTEGWVDRSARSKPRAQGATPVRAVVLSLACLAVAMVVGLTDRDAAARYSSFVWILAILPVFLLSYYRGWRGASLAVIGAMLALTAVEIAVIRLQGEVIDWWLFGTATTLLVPTAIGAGVVSEILRRQRTLALEMAYGDPMTNVGNRRWLREAVALAIEQAGQTRKGVGLVFLDLVDFKRVNDSHGHAVGDEVLRQLARRLLDSCRQGDSVARVGGDEFVICCTQLETVDTAVRIAERTLDAFAHPVTAGDHEIYVRARVGVAWYPEHASTFDELLSNADPAGGGEGKPSGGEIVVYNPTSDTSPSERALVESDLREAMERDALFLALQPIIELQGQSVVGGEALARLHHPRLGEVQAGAFVATARAAGLMYRLDMAVLELAASLAVSGQLDASEWVSVNISYESLSTYGFLGELEAVLKRTGLDPGRLVVEISTGPSIRNSEWITATLESISGVGVRVALDNFGPRTFSLAYLEDVLPDLIKLDRSLVEGLGKDSRRERVVRGILGLAGSLDIATTAVGVERPEQLAWLQSAGCQLAQGYLIGAPAAVSIDPDRATAVAG